MAEALILSLMQKLEHKQERISCLSAWLSAWLPCFFDSSSYAGTLKMNTKVIDELRAILDIVRDKKSGEGRGLCYFICDLVDMAHQLYRLKQTYYFHEEIDFTRSWIADVKMRMLELGDGDAETEINVGEGDDDNVVGLEEDVELLLRTRIINHKGKLSTLLVKGMAGIGKTTLARQVYNHAAVVDGFDRRVWVCVSDELTQKELLMKLIEKVVDSEEFQRDSLIEKMERADNQSLQRMLRQHLKGMRYFIVLDDLPKLMPMKTILQGLPDGGKGGILLITSHTTSTDIKKIADYIHQMKPLDSNKSWQLLLKTINCGNEFTSEDKFPKHLEKKGREMLAKCSGLPLAIKEMGRQLAEKRQSGMDWEQVVESTDLGATLELLESFYHKLDPLLKSCFMHLAFFKENTTMRKEKLTQIWDVGGVVAARYAPTCLDNLINDSVIEVTDKSTRYRINAILHKLSIKKAEEEIGFEILRSNGNHRTTQSPRHRVIICSRDKFNYSMNHGNEHLASLFLCGGGYLDASSSYWKCFELLKILDMEDFGLKKLPEAIGTLIELRYLGLRNNYIQELPDSLGCLKKLEVLDIALNFMVELPDIIWEMDSLRHLYMSDVVCRKPLKIDAMEKLETLTYISMDNWTYKVSGLKMMTSLRKLGIEKMDENSDGSKLIASIARIWNIKHLILRGCRFRKMPSLDKLGILNFVTKLKLDGLLARLPSNFPPITFDLTLVNSCLDEDPMPVLAKLSFLYHLKLKNAYTGQQMVILKDGFSFLLDLRIEESWNLRNVQVGEGAMRRLRKLEIHNCPYLETLPEEIWSKTC